MNILIVDGNEKEASDRYIKLGMNTQYDVYSKVINKISNYECNVSVIHPAITDDFLPLGVSLDDFDGIAWTGSLLNIYDMSTSITRQIDLAKNLFTKKNKIFGSCWGLHVLVTAAGGIVRKNPNGLEAVVAKKIKLNANGISHRLYKGKKDLFDSFCWHYDEAESLPENSTVLSSNKKSKIQSVVFERNQSQVWAVQYHPEFDPSWIAGLMDQRKKILLGEKMYNSEKEFIDQKNYFDNYKFLQNEQLEEKYSDLINEKMHTLELSNWIEFLKQ
ncbi:MAG: Gamma-glutamyl-L-1-hydroxyisopropylamide hydrolase [Alphaproteobacteria bacterium MarineAlpha5_Bin11]|nr:hypothetical protein [Pelagibacteraceae bacterium]PPR44246.1 MAG: Gamma-glutamyl-L-1-hydroxyisopropylamide hydrolase [Alphaproteobacteria bacterium MarineAlpha5_Bin11]PPR51864.1 MAG: Gamma-glutamyl-L-1-hydroxyisopropylamide hydrolase [Alphaproteobacteria bacterium MarineAlpha5_Bin10]